MGKTAKIVIALFVVVFVAVLAVLMVRGGDDNNTNGNEGTDNSESNQQPETNNPAEQNQNAEEPAQEAKVTITYTANGFQLSGNKIKAGESVKVTNSSNSILQFASDPHPVHTDNDDLNAGSIAPGESKTFVVEKRGEWGFHNHANASHNGSLTVD